MERYRAEDYELAATWCLRATDVRPCLNCLQHAVALRNGCKESDAGTTTNRGAVDDLAKIGHAFLAYEHAPFADQGEYRAELLAVLREVVNRHAGGQ